MFSNRFIPSARWALAALACLLMVAPPIGAATTVAEGDAGEPKAGTGAQLNGPTVLGTDGPDTLLPAGFAKLESLDVPLPTGMRVMDNPYKRLLTMDEEKGGDPAFWKVLFHDLIDLQTGKSPLGSYVPDFAADQWYLPPPQNVYRDFYPVCDLNNDKLSDIVSNDFDRDWGRSNVKAMSGDSGRVLWSHDNMFFFRAPGFWPFYEPMGTTPGTHGGNPMPERFPFKIYNFAPGAGIVDADHDGVCDFFTYSMEAERYLGFTPIILFHINFYLLSGVNGRPIWQMYQEAVFTALPDPCSPRPLFYRLQDFPTAIDMFSTTLGPRVMIKTTNITWVQNGCTGVSQFLVEENITLRNAEDNHIIWKRLLKYPNPWFTMYVGHANLITDGEKGPEEELVLDQLRFDQRPFGCVEKTLRGRDGGDYWEGQYNVQTDQRSPYANGEEAVEVMIWCWSYIVPDLRGDGVPDIMGSFLAKTYFESNTLNGRYKTHFRPMDGLGSAFTIKLIWKKDIRTQGWGYAQGLDPRSGPRADPVPLIATGTVDPPPILLDDPNNAPGGRFPDEGMHLNVLNLTDGLPLYFYEEQYATDSYISWDLYLKQFKTALAPGDYNGDGILDVVSGAEYVQPTGAVQVLLSMQEHKYTLFDGNSMDPIREIAGWSGQGIVLQCGGSDVDSELTIISGHSKRIDMTRYDAATGNVIWRRPLFNDSTFHSAAAGGQLTFVGYTCSDTGDGRTMFGINLGAVSLKRGAEIIPINGFISAEGELVWVTPELNGKPPLVPSLKIDFLLYEPKPEPSVGQKYFMAFVPVVPGLSVGLGIGMAINRAVRGRNRK